MIFDKIENSAKISWHYYNICPLQGDCAAVGGDEEVLVVEGVHQVGGELPEDTVRGGGAQ